MNHFNSMLSRVSADTHTHTHVPSAGPSSLKNMGEISPLQQEVVPTDSLSDLYPQSGNVKLACFRVLLRTRVVGKKIAVCDVNRGREILEKVRGVCQAHPGSDLGELKSRSDWLYECLKLFQDFPRTTG